MQLNPKGSGNNPPSQRRATLRLLLVVCSVVLFAIVAEIALRLGFSSQLALVQDERNLLYRYDDTLGWFPMANSSNQFLGSRRITVVHNSEGFRGPEYAMSSKPRILFLGDSFVWGYDAELGERFTDKLQAKHPEWAVYNFGVSGYGTDQEYILLQKRFDWYQPQVVFLMFSTETDDKDNSTNCEWGYYKPYCSLDNNRLALHGIPVPKSEKFFLASHRALAHSYLVRLLAHVYYSMLSPQVIHVDPNPTGAIIRDMQRYTAMKGAVLVVGLTRTHPELEKFLDYFKIPWVDVSTPLRYIGMGEHWTPEGNTFVAEKVDDFLLKGKFMEPRASQMTTNALLSAPATVTNAGATLSNTPLSTPPAINPSPGTN